MILVTGATGLVGAHLCLNLLKKNETIIALYRREKKKVALEEFFKSKGAIALFEKIQWRQADLCDLPALTIAFKDITQVYHCAAYISMAYYKLHQLQEVNQQGTTYIANLCIENNIIKLVYVSSIAALGSQTTTGIINEDTPWNPTVEKTPYAYSKYGAELEIWRASQEGIPVAIVNPGVILGEGMPRNPLDQLVQQIEKGLSFYPTGKTGYVAVEDVVEVMETLMYSSIENERFILVAENWSYQRMTQFIAQKMGEKAPSKVLYSSYLKIAWVIESILSGLGLKKKFLTKALIKSLADTREIDGSKVENRLSFSYRKIDPYLDSIFKGRL